MILENIDAAVLERALHEQSQGTMVAPLCDVVRLAVEKWGYPGSLGSAEAILMESGRYLIEVDPTKKGQFVRPRA